MDLEQALIHHCSPTLAGLKTANLFMYGYGDKDALLAEIEEWNHRLQDRGVTILLLRQSEKRALLYVYRRRLLKEDLQKPGVLNFLYAIERDYQAVPFRQMLEVLSRRFQHSDDFPHEIGLFLGYPLHDVIGFVLSGGKNCLFCGCWKVYADLQSALKMFEKYRRCKNVYLKLYQSGRPLLAMTVAA